VDCGIDTAGALLGIVLLYAGRRLHASNSNKKRSRSGVNYPGSGFWRGDG
jgi:hypothetical protein